MNISKSLTLTKPILFGLTFFSLTTQSYAETFNYCPENVIAKSLEQLKIKMPLQKTFKSCIQLKGTKQHIIAISQPIKSDEDSDTYDLQFS